LERKVDRKAEGVKMRQAGYPLGAGRVSRLFLTTETHIYLPSFSFSAASAAENEKKGEREVEECCVLETNLTNRKPAGFLARTVLSTTETRRLASTTAPAVLIYLIRRWRPETGAMVPKGKCSYLPANNFPATSRVSPASA
jgi:hypothetical protein